jgi:hypothetical protein
MTPLLADQLAPLTSEIGFIEIDCAIAAEAFAKWQAPNLVSAGMALQTDKLSFDSVEHALKRLLPLTSVLSTRSLFVATASRWTAFFENSVRGADAMPPMSYLAKVLQCRGLRIVAVADSITRQGGGGRYGATILEVYGPEDAEFLNYIRSIAAVNDGGKWVFSVAGTPLAFEETARYKARAVRDRFTPEMLDRYLQALGVHAFEEGFYHPANSVLATKTGRLPGNVREYSLEEALAKF